MKNYGNVIYKIMNKWYTFYSRYGDLIMNKDVSKKFLDCLGKASDKHEKELLKQLYMEYMRIQTLGDYNLEEEKLYGGMDNYNKLSFELKRIESETISRKKPLPMNASLAQVFIEKGSIDNELYNMLAEQIIMSQLELKMKIGLYSEVCELFEKKIDYKENLDKTRILDVKDSNKLVKE